MTDLHAGEILARHPSGACVQAYLRDGQIYSALYVAHGGLVKTHPQGGWGVYDPLDRITRKLTGRDRADLAEILPMDGQPPLLPEQAAIAHELGAAGDAGIDVFRRWSMKELLAEPDDFTWLIRGLLADPTHGQIAGELKTLKTYLVAMIQVGLAAGKPTLDRFRPVAGRPVLAYVGEGGRKPYMRRLKRIAVAMAVNNLADIPLELVFDVAPIQSPIFIDSLDLNLAELEPALVCIDPYYAYHGTVTRAADLHQEGALLSGLSAPLHQRRASLLVVNHMNQTGSGVNLRRITMAGSGEWVDSWALLAHREAPNVDAGTFKLRLEIGSRQWGGTTWDLDLGIGHFDQERGTHDGPIRWDLRPATGVAIEATEKTTTHDDKLRARILDVITDMPWELTKTDILDRAGGNRERGLELFNKLADDGRIRHDKRSWLEAGIPKTRSLWGIADNPAHADGHSSPWENK